MKVGILYNFVEQKLVGRDIDKIADNEVIVTSNGIKTALIKHGHEAELIKVTWDMNGVSKYDHIFNLAEGIEADAKAEPTVAANLEKLGIPFTGASSHTLRNAIDKRIMKTTLVKHNIRTPDYQVTDKVLDSVNLRFPLIVKPAHEHGSIGITNNSVVFNMSQLKNIVRKILDSYKQPVIIEEYIDGREINAAIIGNGTGATILPLSEIVFTLPDHLPKIVSFEAKWIENTIEYNNTEGKCPADLDENVKKEIEFLALKAYAAMNGRDYARVDFRIRDNIPYVLEVNPNPCINPHGAGFIRSAKAAGYSYDQIIKRILEISRQRYPQEVLISKMTK